MERLFITTKNMMEKRRNDHGSGEGINMGVKAKIADFRQKIQLGEKLGGWMLAFGISFSLLGNLFLKADLRSEYITWIVALIGGTVAAKFIVMKLCIKINAVEPYFHVNNGKVSIICTLIFAGNTMIYWIAFYPGNMFVDTYYQFTQIFGSLPNGDWHSFGHTLFMKVVMQICDNPAMIVFVQIIAMVYIIFRIFREAAKMGYHPKFLYFISGMLSINLSYGLLIVNIWKDTLYTICLLYLFFFLYRNVDSNFTELHDLLIGVFGFLGVLFFRHNGFMVALLVLMVMITLSRMKFKMMVFAGAIISSYFLVTTCVFSVMEVEENAKITGYLPLLHGIAAVEFHCGADSLDEDTREFMDSLLPEDGWVVKYNPYNGDPLLFETDGILQERCERLSMLDVLKPYVRTFFRNPFLIIKDRMASCELVWSVFPTVGSYNHIVGLGIDNRSFYNDTRLHQEFGVQEITPNEFTTLIQKCFYMIHDHVFLNIIHFRPAWLFWILGFSMLCIPVCKRKKWVAVLPICLNTLSLLIAMNFQAFRYVWYVFECVPFVVLLLYGETIGGNRMHFKREP